MSIPKQVQEAAARADQFYSNPSEEQPVEQAPVEQVAPVEDWKKRFTGYKAATDKTIHELRQQVGQMQQASEDVAGLQAQIEELKGQVPTLSTVESDLFSEDEINTFDKLVDAKTSGMKSELDALKAERARRVEQDKVNASQASHNKMVEVLKQAVPEFDEIDHDPNFHSYLNDVNEYGQIRMDMLKVARTNNDVERIVKLYEDFKVLTQVQPTPTQRELQQQPSNQQTTPQAPAQARSWDDSMVQQFYKDKVQGNITPEEAAFLEAEMYQVVQSRQRR